MLLELASLLPLVTLRCRLPAPPLQPALPPRRRQTPVAAAGTTGEHRSPTNIAATGAGSTTNSSAGNSAAHVWELELMSDKRAHCVPMGRKVTVAWELELTSDVRAHCVPLVRVVLVARVIWPQDISPMQTTPGHMAIMLPSGIADVAVCGILADSVVVSSIPFPVGGTALQLWARLPA